MVLTKWSGRRTGASRRCARRWSRVCGDEAEVRICEATLSRTEEECHPTVRGVRAGESVLGAEKTVALGTGLARERSILSVGAPMPLFSFTHSFLAWGFARCPWHAAVCSICALISPPPQ